MTDARRDQSLVQDEPASVRSLPGLAVLLLVTTLLIGGTWQYTHQRIADNEARRTLAEISAVLPARLYDNEPHKDVVLLDAGSGQALPVYRAYRNGSPVAAVLTALASDGYVGPIGLLVGIAVDGRVLGVRVTTHTETPGIGAAIAGDNSSWLGGFTGRSLHDPAESRWTLRADGGDFDAIAGATVSSRATVGGIRRTVQYFTTHQAEVFAPAKREK